MRSKSGEWQRHAKYLLGTSVRYLVTVQLPLPLVAHAVAVACVVVDVAAVLSACSRCNNFYELPVNF